MKKGVQFMNLVESNLEAKMGFGAMDPAKGVNRYPALTCV